MALLMTFRVIRRRPPQGASSPAIIPLRR